MHYIHSTIDGKTINFSQRCVNMKNGNYYKHVDGHISHRANNMNVFVLKLSLLLFLVLDIICQTYFSDFHAYGYC